ncbi:MAG: class I SAM-dependent methyltransferase [Candidatus Hermodarchaeota archaeon]
MISKILKTLWLILNKIPRLKKSIYNFYAWRLFEIVPTFKKLIYKFYDKFWYLELLIDINDPDFITNFPNSLYIDTTRLNYYLGYKFYSKDIDFILDENLDNSSNLKKIKDSYESIFLNDHFLKKMKWEESDLFETIFSKLNQKKTNAQEFDKNLFLELLNSLDDLYFDFNIDKIKNKIKVGIGRNGEFILIDGIFYVSLLHILNEKTIPIYVIYRHSHWIKFCNEFIKFQKIHGEVYQPLIHPDLNLKTSYYSDKRFKIIKDNLNIKTGSVLDIGANWGYFCHSFEDLGFNCYAVEIRPSNIYFMKKLREIEGKKFKIINKSIFDLKTTKEFDIVIALNIFHHFLREEKLYFELIEFLKKIKMKVMFFQPHNPNEEVMQNAYINYNNREFVDFIIKYSCLNKAMLLNEKVDGRDRPIYKLFK